MALHNNLIKFCIALVIAGIVFVEQTFAQATAKQKVTIEFDLPISDCVINGYQDSDGNGELSTNWIGMPKEPVGISNWEGSGITPSFDKLKVEITEKTQKITVKLHKI